MWTRMATGRPVCGRAEGDGLAGCVGVAEAVVAAAGVGRLAWGAEEQALTIAHEVPRTNQARSAMRICL